MENELSVKLQGSEFIATIFNKEEETVMFWAMGENMDRQKEGMTFIFLYKCIDGEVEYGVETFVFETAEEAHEFLRELPTMSAIDFLTRGIGVPPLVYDS